MLVVPTLQAGNGEIIPYPGLTTWAIMFRPFRAFEGAPKRLVHIVKSKPNEPTPRLEQSNLFELPSREE